MHHLIANLHAHAVAKRLSAFPGQGVVEYALVLAFSAIGLVIVTSAFLPILTDRTGTAICNVGNEGRAPRTAEECRISDSTPSDPEAPVEETEPLPEAPPSEWRLPIANFTCTCSGLDCVLDASSSFDQDEGTRRIVEYSWDLGTGGDRVIVEDPVYIKTYTREGVYTIRLNIKDDETQTASTTGRCIANVRIGAPLAAFNAVNTEGLIVSFDGSISRDTDEDGAYIRNFEWDIDGDGTYEFDTDDSPFLVHEYDEGGLYEVTLRVTDDEGLVSRSEPRSIPVGISPVALASGVCDATADFTGGESYDQEDPDAPDNGLAEWSWDFGVGEISPGVSTISGTSEDAKNPSGVIFPAAEEYPVTLTVTDEDGNTDAATITVRCGNQTPQINAPVTSFEAIAGGPMVINQRTTVTDDEDDPETVRVYVVGPDLEAIEKSFVGDEGWLDVDPIITGRSQTVRYEIDAPSGSEGLYRGELCAQDPVNAPECIAIDLLVSANNVPRITTPPLLPDDGVLGYKVLEGETFLNTDIPGDNQYAWDLDLDAELTIDYWWIVDDVRQPVPGFFKSELLGYTTTTEDGTTARRLNFRYELTPGFGDAGTYLMEACVTDGLVTESTCEQFSIIVEAPAEGTGPTCPTSPSFDGYAPGSFDAGLFGGMTIESYPPTGSGLSGEALAEWRTAHPPAFYNSTSGVDTSLNTPHTDFGGTGVGAGGASGSTFQNDTALGNLLVIAQSASGTTDDHNDGGRLRFTFGYPAVVGTMTFVDVAAGNAPFVRMYDIADNLLTTLRPFEAGENSVVPLNVAQGGVARLEVEFPAGGALNAITFCDGDDGSDGEEDTLAEGDLVLLGDEAFESSVTGFGLNAAQLHNKGSVAAENISLRLYFSLESGDTPAIYSAAFTEAITQRNPDEIGLSSSILGPVNVDGSLYYFEFTILDELPPGAYYDLSLAISATEPIVRSNDWTQGLESIAIFVDGKLINGTSPELPS